MKSKKRESSTKKRMNANKEKEIGLQCYRNLRYRIQTRILNYKRFPLERSFLLKMAESVEMMRGNKNGVDEN